VQREVSAGGERSVGGGKLFQPLGPAAAGQDRKILVAAGFAAVGGNSHETTKQGKRRVYVLGRNALQFGITADGTVGVERFT
jgi:hypothetical protein